MSRPDALPISKRVVGHCRDAGGLLLQQRIDVEALLQHGDAAVAAVGRDAELGHPGEEGILVAEEPDAQGMAGEILRRVDAAVLAAGQRSEEHTSELQSLMRISYDVFSLKKKKENLKIRYI